MKPVKTPLLLAVVGAATLTYFVEARESGRNQNNPLCPRRYDYHRRYRPNSFDLVSDMFSVPFYSTNTLFRQQRDQLTRLEHTTTPRYSISHSEDGTLVELAMEVPGVTAKDLSVAVEDGSILRIKGSRMIRESGSLTKSEFDQSFNLDKDVDVENISVSLSSGILTVAATKKDATIRRIRLKILESDHKDISNNDIGTGNEGVNDHDETESNVGDNEGDDFVVTEDE